MENNNKRKEYLITILHVAFYFFAVYVLSTLIFSIVKFPMKYVFSIDTEYIKYVAEKRLTFEQTTKEFQIYYLTSSATANLVMYLIIFIVLFCTGFKVIKEDFITLREKSAKVAFWIPVGLIVTYVIYFTVAICLTPYLTDQSENQQSINQILSSSPTNALMMIICATIIGPFVEEFIFRHALFKIIKVDFFAIIISSILFGLLHTIDSGYETQQLILQTLPYCAFGFGIAATYSCSKHNLWVTTIIHMFINTVSMFLTLLIF